jgi:GntR family transcriptional regulator
MQSRAVPQVLDRSSPLPLYHQLAGWLEARIADGTYRPGDRLPSETHLARQFGLNRNTVRHALAYLARQGLVESRRGVGTFVLRQASLRPVRHLGHLTSFVDDFAFRDVDFQDRLLAKGLVTADADLAGKLGLPPGSSLIRIERLRLADGTPFVLERQYYDPKRFPGLLQVEIKGSMYRLLTETFGADLHRSTQTLRAAMPSRRVAERLGIGRGVPCMVLESVAYDSQGRPIEYLEAYYRGDRYRFQIESGEYRRDAGGGR